MASPRYMLNIKPEDLQPDQPPQPLTPKQKRENFWFYHKWHVLGGILALILVGTFIYDMVSKEEPDIEISFVTPNAVPQPVLEELSTQLEQNGSVPDANGDGKVVVFVNQYNVTMNGEGTEEQGNYVDYQAQAAGTVKLSVDIQQGSSTIFITDALENLNNLTDAFNESEGAVAVDWQQASGLSGLNMQISDPLLDTPLDVNKLLEDFKVVRRGYTGNEKEEALERAKLGDTVFETFTGVESRW